MTPQIDWRLEEKCPQHLDYERLPTIDELKIIPFLNVDKERSLSHPFEKRGYISVPIDWTREESSPKIDIFFRKFKANPSQSFEDPSFPLAVVINGGPGYPSYIYRHYDHGIGPVTEEQRDIDRIGPLLEHFHVLIMDQRGTSQLIQKEGTYFFVGHSAPLDMENPHLDPVLVTKYFGPEAQARDLQAIIQSEIDPSREFFLIAQSYGGSVGSKYLFTKEITTQPSAFVYACAVTPYMDPISSHLCRRQKQKSLNQQLFDCVPEVVEDLRNLMTHFERYGLCASHIHHLWQYLGKGTAGEWELKLRNRVVKMLEFDRTQLQHFIKENLAEVSLLNYIISASANTPGFTDNTLIYNNSHQIPLPNPMLNEHWPWTQLSQTGTHTDRLIQALDNNVPPPIDYPSKEEIRDVFFTKIPVLFTFGKEDAYVDPISANKHAKQFEVPGMTRYELLNGGHGATFTAEGATVLRNWLKSQRE